MDLSYIKSLVGQKESAFVELKSSTGQLERGMETLCAFLNGDGGTVLFGVEDDGRIVGQQIADKTKRQIAECLRQFEPFPLVDVDYVAVEEDRYVVVLSVANNREKPYLYRGRAYVRLESTTSMMSQRQYGNLLSFRNLPFGRWETQLNDKLTVSDLDEEEVLRTVRVGVEKGRLPEVAYSNNVTEALTRMNLMRDGQLTNAAFVLYAKTEHVDYPQCLLRLARFAGITKEVFVDQRRVEGNVFRMLDEAMQFCFKHLSLSGEVKGLAREERLSIPYKALREAIVNALCHREYQTVGGSVGVAIFDDRVEVSNIGHFPNRIKTNNLTETAQSIPYNPLIAKGFYYRELFENWGRGIRLMVDECKIAGLAEPVFSSCEYLVTTIFYRNDGDTSLQDKLQDKLPEKLPEKLPNKLPDKLLDKLIRLIQDDESVTIERLSKTLKVSEKTVRIHLKRLVEKGLIVRVGARKNGHWKVV